MGEAWEGNGGEENVGDIVGRPVRGLDLELEEK